MKNPLNFHLLLLLFIYTPIHAHRTPRDALPYPHFIQKNHKSSSSSSSLSVWNVPRGGGSIDHRYFIAGGTCAAISHGITTPIDVVKTRMQSSPEKYNQGMIHALTFMVREEGVGVLLAGLGPTVIGYAVEGAMKFGVYEVSKPFVKKVCFYIFIGLYDV